jgi:hypothetical protein
MKLVVAILTILAVLSLASPTHARSVEGRCYFSVAGQFTKRTPHHPGSISAVYQEGENLIVVHFTHSQPRQRFSQLITVYTPDGESYREMRLCNSGLWVP